MEIFTLNPHSWRVARIFGRNPLLRRADRIEALVMMVVFVVALLAVPVAGVVGAMTYGARDRLYTQEAQERHRVMATVLDIWVEDLGVAIVQAKWPAPAGERTGPLQLTNQVKSGQDAEIWIDNDGAPVAPPTPTWVAVGEAIGMAGVTLLAVGVGMAALVAAVRSRLDQARDAAWERDINCLADAS